MKVLDVRVDGREKGVYLECGACGRRWREALSTTEARCPDCPEVAGLLDLVEAWAWEARP